MNEDWLELTKHKPVVGDYVMVCSIDITGISLHPTIGQYLHKDHFMIVFDPINPHLTTPRLIHGVTHWYKPLPPASLRYALYQKIANDVLTRY